MNAQRRQDLESELVTLEDDILPDLQKQLASLTDPNYKPADNPDHELREQDIEFLSTEISKTKQRIATVKATLTSNTRI